MKDSTRLFLRILSLLLAVAVIVVVLSLLTVAALNNAHSAPLPPAARSHWIMEAEGLDPHTGAVVVETFQASKLEFDTPEGCLRALVDIGPEKALDGIVFVLRCHRIGPEEKTT